MNSPLTPLVLRAIDELQDYARTPTAKQWGSKWFDDLCFRLKRAISQPENQQFEVELHAVFHSLVDSGPSAAEAAPSLNEVMNAMQRRSKRAGEAKP